MVGVGICVVLGIGAGMAPFRLHIFEQFSYIFTCKFLNKFLTLYNILLRYDKMHCFLFSY